MLALVFMALICVFGLVSCALLDNIAYNPKKLPDYDNRLGIIQDYKVGDRFETLIPMFLTQPVGTWLSMSEPGIGAPTLDQYNADPEAFGYVLKRLPIGTGFHIVAIKDDGTRSPMVYIQLDGTDEWVGISICEHRDGLVFYNRHKVRKRE